MLEPMAVAWTSSRGTLDNVAALDLYQLPSPSRLLPAQRIPDTFLKTKHRGFGGQQNYSLWYCGNGYVALYIYPNPQNAHRQERTPV